MEIDMISTEELKKRKQQLESALHDVNIALNHPEYVQPFLFKRNDTIKEDDLHAPLLKSIYKRCVQNGSGFDPNLITQHIEKEALDQFNEIVTNHIKGLDIKKLMELRHELELLMLKERSEHYEAELEKINKLIVESVTGVTAGELVKEDLEKVVKIDKRRKGSK